MFSISSAFLIFLAVALSINCDPTLPGWPTNVVLYAGPQNLGLCLPLDGIWYDLVTRECYDLPARAFGMCGDLVADGIAVADGNGPWSFVSEDGFVVTIDRGFQVVGPPQPMVSGACGI